MGTEKLRALFSGKKPWLLMLLGILGMVLILISSFVPSGETAAPAASEDPAAAIEARLSALISQIDGAGRTEVMVTLQDTGSTRYLSESDETEEWADGLLQRKETSQQYVTSGGGAVEVASLTPTVEGVAVVCEGGGSAQVQNDIYEVIYALYGLSSSHVTVEKMR